MAKQQLKRAGEVFEGDLTRDLRDPEFARIYALKLAKVNAIADILGAIEAAREEKHLSKAEIGRRIDRKPSAVSRLLGGSEQNPTWDTLVDLAYAVDLELEVKVKKVTKRRAAPEPVKVLRAA
jgi:ribosome-binding protein aMBF1 (putative translation factor)